MDVYSRYDKPLVGAAGSACVIHAYRRNFVKVVMALVDFLGSSLSMNLGSKARLF